MSPVVILFAAVFGIMAMTPVFAQGSEASVNITGGSQASQDCVTSKSCYEPDLLTIPPRTTVVWTNMDNTAHTVTSGLASDNKPGTEFDSGEIGPGGTYSFIFMSPGTYNYFCTIQPWMTGQVIVSPLKTGTAANAYSIPSNNATTPEFGPAATIVLAVAAFASLFLAKINPKFRLS